MQSVRQATRVKLNAVTSVASEPKGGVMGLGDAEIAAGVDRDPLRGESRAVLGEALPRALECRDPLPRSLR